MGASSSSIALGICLKFENDLEAPSTDLSSDCPLLHGLRCFHGSLRSRFRRRQGGARRSHKTVQLDMTSKLTWLLQKNHVTDTSALQCMYHLLLCSIQYRVVNENADDAFCELQNPKEQIQAYVFDVVRAHVPRMNLDELFEQKGEVAKAVLEELGKVMGEYGYSLEQILMVDIIPDKVVRSAMNKINAGKQNIVEMPYRM